MTALLGGAGFVRLDRAGDALFVSDFPARSPDMAAGLLEQLALAGWDARARGGLCLVDITLARWQALCQTLLELPSKPGLRYLLLPHAREARAGDLPALRRALRLAWRGDAAALARLSGAALALALRHHEQLPDFYPALLNLWEREGTAC